MNCEAGAWKSLKNKWLCNSDTFNLIENENTHTVFPWIMGVINFCEILRRSKQERFKKQSCWHSDQTTSFCYTHKNTQENVNMSTFTQKGWDGVIKMAINVNHQGIQEDRETQAI